MKITTMPSCRVGWPGATLHYSVRADGATEVRVPERAVGGLQFQVTGSRQVPDGVEAQLEVKVVGSGAT